MIEQQKFEQIKVCLDQDDYENAIALLESCIEENPEQLTYYWYLGLAYLLKENEELAQEIWLSIFLQGSLEEVEQWTTELISFLEIKIQENITSQKLGNAKIIYQVIFVINPDYKNSELLDNLVEALSLFASALSFNKEYQTASEIYLDALKLNPNHAISWHSLALTYYKLEQYSEAEEAIQRAIKYDNLSAQNHHVLGLILEKTEKSTSAIEAYLEVIKQDPNFIDAYNRLGDIYLEQKKADEAVNIYQSALKIFPEDSSILNHLALVYKSLGKSSLASLYFGYAEYSRFQHQSALKYFEEFDSAELGDPDFYLTLLQCYLRCDQAISAINLSEKALSIFPDNLVLKRLNQVILPVLYHHPEEIDFYRQRFQILLTQLIKETQLDTPGKQEEVIKSLGLITNFHLAYQGRNDVEIQIQYADYVSGIMQTLCSQWCQPKIFLSSIDHRKIRIGYISSRFHSLGILYFNWVKYCDKTKFEIYLYDLSGKEKSKLLEYQKLFEQYSDRMIFMSGKPELNNLSQIISDDQLDILIIPEIGMDHIYNTISCLRLAPIQCTTWAHPVTSGSSCIDYFLSSDLMEPINGQEHYSETLVRLPNLGFSLPPVIVPTLNKQRSDFQLREDAIVYLCCQSLFKYLPQHDYIFAKIAKQSDSFQFVFLDPAHGKVVTEKFEKRLDRAFTEFGLDYREYCVFLPRTNQEEFLMLNQLTDIFLDALSWSGGFTTRDAIACGLPVVTCPGEMMRARHSYAILQMLGVTETIAKTEAEYIEIAVRLGLDHEWRQFIRDKIIANQNRLFDDQECVVALENFFKEAVQKHFQQTV
jgi:predicted O-linked N-acetylglucosamine transferase (SPINDLY family)